MSEIYVVTGLIQGLLQRGSHKHKMKDLEYTQKISVFLEQKTHLRLRLVQAWKINVHKVNVFLC